MATLLGDYSQLGGSATLLNDDSKAIGKTKKKPGLNGVFNYDAGGNKPDPGGDTPEANPGTGVSKSFNDFAASAALGTTMASAGGPFRVALGALALGGIDMPANYNTDPSYAKDYGDAYNAVKKEYPGMPSSFHSAIASQRAADAVQERTATTTKNEASQELGFVDRNAQNAAQGRGGDPGGGNRGNDKSGDGKDKSKGGPAGRGDRGGPIR